jgi:hypothetical protein
MRRRISDRQSASPELEKDTYLLGVLVVGIDQAGHGSSIFCFSHQDLTLSILPFALGLGSICTPSPSAIDLKGIEKLTDGILHTALLASWVAYSHY